MIPPRLESARLRIRVLAASDAAFICELLNTPGFLKFIGDRGVRSDAEARAYIDNGPRASYLRHGFGLMAVERLSDGVPVGICGLLKRDTLEHADLGFAFLPAHMGQGFAFESALRVLQWGRDAAGLSEVLAIVSAHNGASIGLLRKLNFGFLRREIVVPGADEVEVYGCRL